MQEIQRVRILHLEDIDRDIVLVADRLEKAGIACDIKVVDSQTDYRKALKEFLPQIIISHSLPSFNSIKALDIARRSGFKIPLIIVAGPHSEDYAIEGLKHGAFDYVLSDRYKRLPVIVLNAISKQNLENDLKEKEERIKSLEVNHRQIIDLIPHPIFVKDLKGAFLTINKKFAELYVVRSASQLKNKRILDCIPVLEQGEKFILEDLEVSNSGNMKIIPDAEFTDHKGEKHLFHITKVPYTIAGTNEKAVLGIAIEITEQKKAEQVLKNAETNCSEIFEKASNAILILDIESGKIINANQKSSEITGYSHEELVNKCPADVLSDNKSVKGNSNKTIWFSSSIEHPLFEWKFKHKDESLHWIEVSSIPAIIAGKERIISFFHDIDNRKKAESSLRRSEEELRGLFAAMTDFVMVLDAEGKYISIAPTNPTSFQQPDERLLGKNISEILPEEEAQKIMRQIDLALKGLHTVNFECDLQIGGKQLSFESKMSPLANNTVFWLARDITERKESEQKLLQKDERLRAILDNEPECVKVVNLSGTILEMNPAGLKMIDAISMDELVGKSIIDLVHPDDRELYNDLHNRVCQGETGTVDFRFLGHKKKERWMESNAVPLKNEDGEIYAILSVARDITDIKKNSDELIGIKNRLEYSESRLKQAQAIAHVGHWEYSFATDRVILSDETCRIYGLSTGENNLSKEEWLGFIHPNDLEFVKSEIKKAETALTNASIHHSIIRKDGEIRFINSESTFDLDVNNYAVGVYGVVHDITEEKQAEIKLKKLLHVTNDQNNRLQNFAYIVSHNIRSHSSNIVGIMNILSDEKNEVEKLKLFEMLKTTTDKLAETIENLNDIVTIQNDKGKKKINLNLRHEVNKTGNAINAIIAQTNTTLNNLIPENLMVTSVPSYLESILLNILTNAVKYRSPHREPVINITAKKSNEHILISIQDNGLGLDLKRHKEKLFGMYNTFHNNTDARGFGLFITKNQIESMGGKIEVESILGKGSTFKIYIND